jgi:hypothetical protein
MCLNRKPDPLTKVLLIAEIVGGVGRLVGTLGLVVTMADGRAASTNHIETTRGAISFIVGNGNLRPFLTCSIR